MADELYEYDLRMEERDVTKVKHLRRIADAAERIARSLEGESSYEPDDDGFIRVGLDRQ